MSFNFKQKSQDFIVEEELPFELTGKGDALFVYFEKRNLNTMDIVEHLCKKFKISRMTLGIAGLKDKKALTRQRISIYKSALKKLGGERVFVEGLAEKARVIKTTRHTQPIGLGTPIKNIFHIRLRANKNLGQEERTAYLANLEKTLKTGYPNLYGTQRFGIEQKNWKLGKDIMNGKLNLKQTHEIKFKLQAFASKIFNEYLHSRNKGSIQRLDGDILERQENGEKVLGIFHKSGNVTRIDQEKLDHKTALCEAITLNEKIPFDSKTMMITGPIIGFNLLVAQSEAGKREKNLLKKRDISDKELKTFQQNKIFGLRRSLRVYPEPRMLKYQNDDILISFALPSGAYASIIIDKLLEK